MKRRDFLCLMGGVAGLAVRPGIGTSSFAGGKRPGRPTEYWGYMFMRAGRTTTVSGIHTLHVLLRRWKGRCRTGNSSCRIRGHVGIH